MFVYLLILLPPEFLIWNQSCWIQGYVEFEDIKDSSFSCGCRSQRLKSAKTSLKTEAEKTESTKEIHASRCKEDLRSVKINLSQLLKKKSSKNKKPKTLKPWRKK